MPGGAAWELPAPPTADRGALGVQHLTKAPPPWLVGPEFWGKSTAGGRGFLFFLLGLAGRQRAVFAQGGA